MLRRLLISLYTTAGAVSVSQGDLRLNQTLLSGLVKPVQSLRQILITPLPLREHDGQVVLRELMPELGRELVPADSPFEVHGYALACAIHDRELELGGGVVI